MSETWDEMLLTVRAGVGQPPQMRMPMDEVLGPLSIGSSGSWCIVAPGVLGEHGYLYFDGTDLFLQSADPQNPLLVDGQPVPDVWTPVYWPCEISLGVARLQYTNPSQTVRLSTALLGQTLPLGFIPAPAPKRQAASSASPAPTPLPTFEAAPAAPEVSPSFGPSPVFGSPPSPEPAAAPEPATGLQLPPKRSPSPKAARPFAPGAFARRAPDPEATRVHPIEIIAAGRGARLKLPDSDEANLPGGESRGSAPPAPTADRFGAPPMIEALPVAPPQPPPGTPNLLDIPPGMSPQGAAPPVPAATTAMRWLKARWEEASGPKKALVVLLPPLIGSVWIIFTEPPQRNLSRPAPPAASATVATSAQVTASATVATSAQVTATPTGEPSSAPAAPLASEKPTAAASARPAETSRAVAPPPPPPTPSSGGKTAPREAADAVAAGAFDQAAKLYDELAKAHPDVPAYAEAARILRAKTKR